MNAFTKHKIKKREAIAWILVFLQFLALSSILSTSSSSKFRFSPIQQQTQQVPPQEVTPISQSSSSLNQLITATTTNTIANNEQEDLISQLKMNNHPNSYYQQRRMDADQTKDSFYEQPVIHHKDAGLVSRVWHSNGSPSIHSGLHQGSCWCSFDEWCVCTPALAIDLIIESGPDHIWVIRREDTGLLALMGGFTEVGETSLETVSRELMEEMNIELEPNVTPALFGVYNDPKRDMRRHTTSVVFIASIPDTVQPNAGDDAKGVVRLALAEVEQHEFFIDHKTVISDYIRMKERQQRISAGNEEEIPPVPSNGDGEPFKRAVCPML